MTAAQLHVEDSGGRGAPVVLAHAIGCDHRMWDGVAALLAPRWRLLRLDLRGHGASPVPPRPWTLAAMAGDVAATLDALGIDRVHFVGLSLGGMVGQAFALDHPERLDRLVLANTTSSYGPEGRAMWEARIRTVRDGGLATLREAVTARYFSGAFRREAASVVDTTMERFLETPVEGYLGACEAIATLDFTESLPRITAPTLVIAGEVDAGTPVAMAQAIVDGIQGARFAVIPGAAHLAAVEKPRDFARLVDEFLVS